MANTSKGLHYPLSRDLDQIRSRSEKDNVSLGIKNLAESVDTKLNDYVSTVGGFNSTLVVDPDGSDTSGNGGPNSPFKTIQKAHDYAEENIDLSKQVIIKINCGSYPENLLVTRPNIHFVGLNHGLTKSTVILGTVTIAISSAVGGYTNDTIAFENLFINGVTNSGSSVVTVSGNLGCTVVMKDVYVRTASAIAKCFDVINTAPSGNRLQIEHCRFLNNQSSGTTINLSNVNAADFSNITVFSGTGFALQTSTTYATIFNAIFDSILGQTTSLNILSPFVPGQNSLILGNVTLINPSVNGNGIDLASGVIANVAQTTFNVGTAAGTGFAVKGVSGAVFVNGNNLIVPGTNNKISTAITRVALLTSLTPA
jgi:hypothetical protein